MKIGAFVYTYDVLIYNRHAGWFFKFSSNSLVILLRLSVYIKSFMCVLIKAKYYYTVISIRNLKSRCANRWRSYVFNTNTKVTC